MRRAVAAQPSYPGRRGDAEVWGVLTVDMDIATLCNALEHTLNPDRDVRRQAEAALDGVKFAPGFMIELLKIVTADEASMGVRQAASIYFKNLVRREWDNGGTRIAKKTTKSELPDEDKEVVRENLAEALMVAPPLIRSQLAEGVRYIAYTDFPEQWPGLFPTLMGNLQSGDQTRMYGALIALRVVCKKFDFAGQGKLSNTLNSMVESMFPLLQQLFEQIVSNEESPEAYEMQKKIAQIFWSCTHNHIPAYLRKPAVYRPWMDMSVVHRLTFLCERCPLSI